MFTTDDYQEVVNSVTSILLKKEKKPNWKTVPFENIYLCVVELRKEFPLLKDDLQLLVSTAMIRVNTQGRKLLEKTESVWQANLLSIPRWDEKTDTFPILTEMIDRMRLKRHFLEGEYSGMESMLTYMRSVPGLETVEIKEDGLYVEEYGLKVDFEMNLFKDGKNLGKLEHSSMANITTQLSKLIPEV